VRKQQSWEAGKRGGQKARRIDGIIHEEPAKGAEKKRLSETSLALSMPRLINAEWLPLPLLGASSKPAERNKPGKLGGEEAGSWEGYPAPGLVHSKVLVDQIRMPFDPFPKGVFYSQEVVQIISANLVEFLRGDLVIEVNQAIAVACQG
jgi:hypothetical protein